MPENGTLTPQQRRAIAAMMSSANMTDVAREAGVGRSTLYRWTQKPAFRAALREAESQALANFSRSLLALSELATQALSDALQPHGVHLSYRLRAVQILTSNLATLLDLAQFDERLTALENAQHDKTT